MGNMRFKVGDRVLIKSLDWYNENKDETDDIECSNNIWFYREMSKFCGKVMTISHVRADHYTMVEDLVGFWTDEMIEGLVEEETKSNIIEEAKTYWDSIKDAWICPKGYQFVDENGNVINATKIILEKKKKEYPKTYGGCCDTLYRNSRHDECYEACLQGYPMQTFARLLICRDAYWKIAGEEMGLEKPWKPDWCDYTTKYCIPYSPQYKGFLKRQYDGIKHILAFPTEEMRDAFYENFKEEIEECKEFL